MIKDIKELNFPPYATLSQATVNLQDMGEKVITSQVKIDGEITPDFSTDWEVEFQGDKYIMPLRQPQGSKENTSLDSAIYLTFQHWAIYQMKRWLFFTVQPIESGTAIADQYIASVSLNLTDFCSLFAQVLKYYYDDTITIDLNPSWESKDEPTNVEISYSYIWDILIKLYDLFAVRWQIEPTSDTEHYVIKIGYPTTELDHIFEYGFNGGLLKIERQVQDENIRNMLLGRGGEKNIPYRYFKNKDEQNPSFPADPDWIPELANIYFDSLRGATFRSYIQGWKAKHYKGSTTKDKAYAPWAWEKGFTDEKFNPVEYVKDDDSIDKYGPLFGGLDNNDNIYPTIQGVVIEPYGRIDEVVDVEQITSDKVDESIGSEPTMALIAGAKIKVSLNPKEVKRVTVAGAEFSVPKGRLADLEINKIKAFGANSDRINILRSFVYVYEKETGRSAPDTGIPEGNYYYEIVIDVENKTEYAASSIVGVESAKVKFYNTNTEDITNSNTFKIWVKNIWETTKSPNETEDQYANRVWNPILGDREGNEAKVIFSSGMLSTSQDYEFIIPKGYLPKYDTSKTLVEKDRSGNIIATYSSHWCITLGKSDADVKSTGLYVPSTKRQGKPGDHFFFIAIDMPINYTLWAENRLDDYKTDELLKVIDIKPTWVVSLDRVRIANNLEDEAHTLLSELRIGCSLRLADKRFIGGSQQEILYLQSLNYIYSNSTDNSNYLIPDVEIVLSDKYEIVANPVSTLRGEVNALQKQISSISNVEQIVRSIGDRKYLRKDFSDRTPYSLDVGGKVTAYKGVQFGNFASGMAGFGGRIDEHGNTELESAMIRRFLEVPELRYNRVDITIGDKWSAPGGGIIDTVDLSQQLVTLKLEKGEIGAVKVGDICMGIFHSMIASENATADMDDSKGNRRFAGFATVYFHITEVLGDRREQFRYELRSASDSYPVPVSPMDMMTFVVYGSFTDASRRTSRYDTRTYQRYLRNVSDWEFTEDNIAAQFGDLSNLSIYGIQMSGYSAYLDNIYMRGMQRSLDGTFVIDTRTKSLLMASETTGMGLAFNPKSGLTQGKLYDPITGRFKKEYDLDNIEQTASNAEQKANTAQQAAQQAQDAIKDAQREITGLKDFTDQTFADGVVDRAEAASIQKYINNISQTRKQVDTTYTAVYENKLLSDEGKQNLQIAKLSFDRNITVLQDAITAAVADGVATQDERAAVDTAYADFIRTYGVFNARIEEANTYIQTAINTTAQGAYTLSSQMLEVLNTVTSVLIPDLQEQVDGSIMTWEGSDAPTLHNYPANQWTNEMERKRHTGDYYDRYQTIDGKEVTERYKFSFRNNTYQWVRVADSEAALAFSEARAALGLAGTKSAISYSPVRPPVPYSVNDVWFRTVGSGASMTMTIHICNVNRTSEEIGSDADWQMVDDTQVRMRAMSSDSIISREEKASLRNTLLQMEQNAHSLRDDAAQYGVGATEVQNAFNTLQSFLRDTVLIGSDTDTTLTEAQRTAYNRYFADFETATSRVGTLVADVLAQQKVNDLQISSVNRIADEYLLRWNDTAPDITTEGSDEDGHYFKIDYAKLYHAVGGGDRFLSIFPELQFEAGRQYGFKIRWKNPQDSPAMAFRIDYTDGTKDQVDLYTVFQKVTVGQVVTRAGKTVQKISVSYFESGYAYIYAICLVEGNKLPQDWPVSPIDVQSRIDTAKRTAQAAQETADTAQQTAQAATTTLTTWASDSYISPQEKTALRQQRKDIQAEYGEITAQAAKYGVSTAVFTSAYDAADTALAKYTAATPESIPVEADYAQIAAYYTARGVILDAIAAAAKAYSEKLVNEVQPVGDNLLTHTKDFTEGWTGAAQSAGEALGGLTVYTAAATQANIDMRQQNNITLLPATVYTLSFWAKGRGTLATFVYPSVNEEITATNGNNAGYEGSDTFNSYTLTADWKRFWVTFRTFAEAKTGNVLFRAMKGGEASVCGAKLAQGNKGIVWTESPADLDEKIEAAKIAADNLGYLKTVFAEDNTITSGGAVVGSFLGVKTSTETVFAGISGKNFLTGQDFTPDDMSCPWLFGGASSAMEANSAKFRVYPGGAVAMSALIAGNGCHIGGFKIANNALFNEYDATINGISYYSSVGLYATGLIDIRKGVGSGDLTYLYIGFYELPKMKDGRIPAISLTASNRYHAGMLLDVPAGASAVEIKSGCIRGFRRSMRYTANSMTLTALDDVIVANNSGAIVITLPPAPQDGEEFEILKNTSSAQITISGNGKQIVSFGVSIANAQVLSAGEDYAIRLTYSSTLGKWFLQKSNGKLT